MRSGAQSMLRFSLILLALANLAMLGKLLWPWQEVPNLPLNGATGIDPAVVLVGYIGLIFWLAASIQEPIQKALRTASLLGLLAGLLLIAEITIKAQTEVPAQSGTVVAVLLAAVALLWGISGLRGAQNTGNGGIGPLAGLWSAMVSGLVAAAGIFGQALFSGPLPVSQDPWRQYEGLAVGNSATQALVFTLNSATFYLLVGPLAGAAIGLFFSLFAKDKQN